MPSKYSTKPYYKISWKTKSKKGFKFQTFWNRTEFERKVKALQRQGVFFRAWRVGDSFPLYTS
jgi:hypothetical protein